MDERGREGGWERERVRKKPRKSRRERERVGVIFSFFVLCSSSPEFTMRNTLVLKMRKQRLTEPDSCVCVQYLSERRFAVLCCHSTVMRVDSNSWVVERLLCLFQLKKQLIGSSFEQRTEVTRDQGAPDGWGRSKESERNIRGEGNFLMRTTLITKRKEENGIDSMQRCLFINGHMMKETQSWVTHWPNTLTGNRKCVCLCVCLCVWSPKSWKQTGYWMPQALSPAGCACAQNS